MLFFMLHIEHTVKSTKNYFAYDMFQQKAKFIEEAVAKQKARGVTEARRLTPEELAEFYKQFLNDNYQLHRDYNWYQ